MSRLRSMILACAAASCFTMQAHAADAALIEAARREGTATVYTTLVINQLVQPMAKAFETKYGVKIQPVRADPAEIIRRVTEEARAGRSQADVFDGTVTAATLKRSNLVMQYLPESAANLPKEFVDPEGYWAAMYILVSVPTVNTDLVKPGDEPKSWDDLLLPRWTGKMVWSSGPASTGAAGFAGLALREFGRERAMEYFGKLAAQRVTGIPAATRQVLDQVMSGEFELAVMSSVHQVLASAAQGAPVKWLPVSPAALSYVTVSVAKTAPRPNAGKLYMDFLLSDEGQKIFSDNFYIPANTRVPPKDPRALPDGKMQRGQFFSPEEIDNSLNSWQKIIADNFR